MTILSNRRFVMPLTDEKIHRLPQLIGSLLLCRLLTSVSCASHSPVITPHEKRFISEYLRKCLLLSMFSTAVKSYPRRARRKASAVSCSAV